MSFEFTILNDASKALGIPWVGYVAGVGVLASVTWKYIIKPIHKFAHKTAEVAEMLPAISVMVKEYQPNGGSSMRDAIDRIESSIQVVNQRLKGYASSDGLAHFECDADGKVTWVNRTFCEVTGLTESEATGNGWVLSVDEVERDDVQLEWRNAVKDNRDFFMKYRCRRRSGESIFVENHATILRTSNGKILGYVGTLRPADIFDFNNASETN